jgi:hypothetical protein
MSFAAVPPVVSVALSARVCPAVVSDPPTLITGDELAVYLGVPVATIGTLTDCGMPVAEPGPVPRYRLGDCFVWFRLFQFHAISGAHGSVLERHVDYQHALLWSTYHEIALLPELAADFVVVPMRHDHPRRLEQLRLACDGLPSVPAEPEDGDPDASTPTTTVPGASSPLVH